MRSCSAKGRNRVVILATLSIAIGSACDFSMTQESHPGDTTATPPTAVSNESIMTKHPHYELIRSYKNANALELMKKYGAHSLGIRWKTENKDTTNELALAFYVNEAPSVGSASGAMQIPEMIEIPDPDSGRLVSIPTEVVVSDQPSPE